MRDRLPTPELISEFLEQGKVSVSLNLLHEEAIHDLDVSEDADSVVISLENTDTNKFRMDIATL